MRTLSAPIRELLLASAVALSALLFVHALSAAGRANGKRVAVCLQHAAQPAQCSF